VRVKKPALHPMVQPALAEIQSAGVVITPEMVVWLQAAALEIRKCPTRPSADIMDFPTPCGGVLLYPLSFGAIAWLTALPRRLRNDVRVIAYACAHSKDGVLLGKATNSIAVMACVSLWALKLKCSLPALSIVVDRLIGCSNYAEVPDHTGKRNEDNDDWEWGTVIKSLCLKYPGTSPEYWCWQVSRDKAIFMISTMQSELPPDLQYTDYEITATNEFRSIVEMLKRGNENGG
jgi:hypothetical protein